MFGAAALLFVIALPVLINGSPLSDEYHLCLRPAHDGGYGPYLADIWADTGVVRPARFVELGLVSALCGQVPFGLIALAPLALKYLSAFLLFGLLMDLGVRRPWVEIGTAAWLLEPLGTEAALWPAALHVLLGLVFALAALRLYRSGRHGWAAIATLAACLSVEQVIFAFPLAVWLLTPPHERRRATLTAVAVVAAVVVAYAAFPGENERQAVSLADRIGNAFSQPEWYLFFPAVGLGLHSGFLALLWALPLSAVVVIGGALGGARAAPRLLANDTPSGLSRTGAIHAAVAVTALVGLVNLPLIVTEVGYSARTFTPTWLVLAGAFAVVGSRIAWRRRQILGALAGVFVAFAVLSLALSAWVRVRTVEFNEASLAWVAEQIDDGDVVAVCDVQRTAVEPAPLGAFHLHAFHSEYGGALEFHTGRIAEVRRSGEQYWGSRCPDLSGADLVVTFDDLVDAAKEN